MYRTSLFLALLLAPIVRAQEPVQLFNGKDLSGWVWIEGSDGKGSKIEDVWSVEDGVLKCKGKPGGYIRTEKDYTNYVLKVEWRFAKPGNSGVLLRMQPPDKVWPKSMEAQLHHENAGDIWAWLQEGAEIFVCGDKERMAADVDRELHNIVETAGGRTPELAKESVEELMKTKRYKRDVY